MYLALASTIEAQLREAYATRHEQGAVNQTSLAEKLGVNKSLIHRRLNGATNMTVQTIADLVWALGQCIEVNIFDPADHPERNDLIFDTESTQKSIIKHISMGNWDDVKIDNQKYSTEQNTRALA